MTARLAHHALPAVTAAVNFNQAEEVLMGRRTSSKKPEDRSSIGDVHVDNACGEINRAMVLSAAVQTHFSPSVHDTIRMLFDPDTIERARRAYGIIDPSTYDASYPVMEGVNLRINYNDKITRGLPPTIMAEQLRLQPGSETLLAYIRQVEAIYLAYEEVKGVLRWLNRNATPGAIRYNWPSAMTLTPAAPLWKDLRDVPTRYTNPPRIHDWIQSIKDSSATVASMLLLPDGAPRAREASWLTFSSRRIAVGSESEYPTDMIHFNI